MVGVCLSQGPAVLPKFLDSSDPLASVSQVAETKYAAVLLAETPVFFYSGHRSLE